jgi:hypothetical protein
VYITTLFIYPPFLEGLGAIVSWTAAHCMMPPSPTSFALHKKKLLQEARNLRDLDYYGLLRSIREVHLVLGRRFFAPQITKIRHSAL